MTDDQKCSSCSDSSCSSSQKRPEETDEQYQSRQLLSSRLCKIKHKVIVLSGKGGVGKSTVAVNLAAGLAQKGAKVGLMDVDIHGPSVPHLLGIQDMRPTSKDEALQPIRYAFDKKIMKVMSIGFMLPSEDDPIIWRGPVKMGLIQQFLRDVNWGELDFLIVDSPPGTGDEPLSVCQLIEDIDGAVVVTLPQQISVVDVKKSINFCAQMNMNVLGVVENMSGMICPKCGETIDHIKTGGGETMAKEMKVPFLGKVPMDPAVTGAADEGKPFMVFEPESVVAKTFEKVIDPIYALLK